METNVIYKDIATRTGGDIYIGVVGPVRCGKSTFIKKFMEEAVIPGITNEYDKKRTTDELPQSSSGKTVMTTEPKFIPDEAVKVSFDGSSQLRVKMIDCVGYMIPEALGATEEGSARMVKTPWSDDLLPFEKAAEIGTHRVITEHSTVGVLVTTDGSFGEIRRDSYIDAEKRIVNELKELGKPFIIVLNSSDPDNEDTIKLAIELENDYKAPVALINCLDLDFNDISHIFEMLLYEFPINEITFNLPAWLSALKSDHRLIDMITSSIKEVLPAIHNLSDIKKFIFKLKEKMNLMCADIFNECNFNIISEKVEIGSGNITLKLMLPEKLYYEILSEHTGLQVKNQSHLISVLTELAKAKKEFDKYKKAISDLEENGYGIVLPDVENMSIEEPQIIRQSGSFGVKLKATAPSVHMIRANIQTEINPIVGSEEQSEELIRCIVEEFENNPEKMWEMNIFGKSLYELLSDGLHTKLAHLSDDSREKLSETLSRIINEGSGGLICIIL